MITDKKYDKDKKEPREQSGMALIMALGILSMLIVLALAFASSARTSSKMANYNANTTKARLLAEGAIERVVALANMYNADIKTPEVIAKTRLPKGAPIDFRYGESGDNDFLRQVTSDEDVKWTYVTAKESYYDDTGNSQERDVIIGRYAYIVTGNPTFIDPAACVEQGSGANNENGLVEDRSGIYVNEINLGNLGAPMEGTVLRKMSSNQTPGGKLIDTTTTTAPLPGDAIWGDLDTMCTMVGITIDPTLESDYDKCSKWFKFPTVEDKEAFSQDDPTILYKRFNLRRFTDAGGVVGIYDPGIDTNWWDDPDNNGTPGSAGTDGDVHVTYLLNNSNLQPTTAATGTDTLCIPYLSNLSTDGDTNGVEHGTFADCATLAKQIAANLIDCCDTDDVPTSDVDPSTWDKDHVPHYTGNEKTPCINELSAKITGAISETNGADPYSYTYSADLELGCELINMYDLPNPMPANTKVEIYGDFRVCTFLGAGAHPLIAPPASEFMKSIPFTNWTNGKYAAEWSGIVISSPIDTRSSTPSTSDASVEVRLNIQKVVLIYDGHEVDYSVVDGRPYGDSYGDLSHVGQGDARLWVANPSTSSTVSGTLWYKWQVKDPRQNLNDEDWDDAMPGGANEPYSSVSYVENDPTTTYHGTWEKTNCDPSSIDYDKDGKTDDQDIETTIDQAEVSTAYIRNDLMNSPWELGAIHRGIAGQTINLLKCHTGTKMLNYDQGDANILDQIKMFSNDKVYGKFNLNCGDVNADNVQEQQEALAALFEGIHLGSDYASLLPLPSPPPSPLPNSGTPISHGDAMDYANDLISDSASGHGGWSRRSQVANAESLQIGATDAEKEELIGKFINLCKAGTSDLEIGSKASIMVIAQTIKDVGGPNDGSANITLYKDLNLDGEIADFTDVDDVDEDGDKTETISETKDTQLGYYESMFDEITSQTILTGKIELDTATNVWTLKRYMYPE